MAPFKKENLPEREEKFMTEEQVRELIAASLANWTGITRFRTIETNVVTTSDFSSATHNHSNAAGGGQIGNSALNEDITVSNGGTGVSTLTGIVKGNGTSAFTAVVPISGTKNYFFATSSGGSPTTEVQFTDGVLSSEP